METTTLLPKNLTASLKSVANSDDFLLWAKINAWDFSRIGLLVQRQHKHSLDEINLMIDEYKKYIFLVTKYPNIGIPMSSRVDDIWHAHIVSTHNYQDFCNQIAGRYINHIPVINDDEVNALSERYINNTRVLMEKYFGINEHFWPIDSSFACCETLAEGYGNQ